MKIKTKLTPPKLDAQQQQALEGHFPRGWTLKRKTKDGVEGWELSAFPLTTSEVEEILERLQSTGLK